MKIAEQKKGGEKKLRREKRNTKGNMVRDGHRTRELPRQHLCKVGTFRKLLNEQAIDRKREGIAYGIWAGKERPGGGKPRR